MTFRAVVAVVIGAVSLVAGLGTGRDLFFSLGYLWLGLVVVSWIWSRASLSGVRLRRRPRGLTNQVGMVLEESLVLENRTP